MRGPSPRETHRPEKVELRRFRSFKNVVFLMLDIAHQVFTVVDKEKHVALDVGSLE